MMKSTGLFSPEYRKPLGIALGLHVSVLILLGIQAFSFSHPAKPIEIVAGEPIITAKTVSQKEVATEIKRLEQAEHQRQEQIQAQNEKIRLEKEQMKKEKEEALLAIAQAKKEKEALDKKAELEKKKLAELKEKQETLKREEEARKKAQLQKEAEQKKKAELAAREAAEKKKAELAAKEKADRLALESQEGERVRSEVMRYTALITQKIRQNWTVQGSIRAMMEGKVKIRLAPGGNVIDVKLLVSSGDEMLDRSAITAVYRSSPLPVSQDQKIFDELRDITWAFRPSDTLSLR